MATTVVPWVIVSRSLTSAVGTPGARPTRRISAVKSGPGSSPGVKKGMVTGAEATGSSVARWTRGPLLAALLHEAADEVLSVGLEHLVDLVEQVVELGLQLRALLGRDRCFLDLDLGLLLTRALADLLTFGHGTSVRSGGGWTTRNRAAPAARPRWRSRRSSYPHGQPFRELVPSSGLVATAPRRCRTPGSPSWRPRRRRRTSVGTCRGSRPGCRAAARSWPVRPRRRR